MLEAIVLISVFAATWSGVKIFRGWSLRRRFLDIPNERSSHTVATPRGGGLIIVLATLTAYALWSVLVAHNFNWSYFLGAVLIASISWLDDIFSVSVGWRFLIHALAALIVVFGAGYFQASWLPFFGTVEFGLWGAGLTFFWIVWLTNAYNFMDGIDGIAAVQTMTAGLGWLAAGKILGLDEASFFGGVLAFSGFGFLLENWQPAKIFMGDVGSAFLGFTFAVMPFLAPREISERAALLPLVTILLVWLFVFDTVYTFIRRLINGEKVWQAHRSHIYQRMVIAGWSHKTVTGLYGLISVLTVILVITGLKTDAWKQFLAVPVAAESVILFIILLQSERKNHRL